VQIYFQHGKECDYWVQYFLSADQPSDSACACNNVIYSKDVNRKDAEMVSKISNLSFPDANRRKYAT
jgi:hypothetical protein